MQENITKSDLKTNKITEINLEINGKNFTFIANKKSIYNANYLKGIKYFLGSLLMQKLAGTNLDFNCNDGICGIILASFKKSEFYLYDENEDSLKIATQNVEKNNLQSRVKIVDSNNFEKVEYRFDQAFFTPPTKIKKDKLFKLYDQIHRQLDNGGSMFILLPIKDGALTSFKYLQNIYRSVTVLDHYNGFQILKCTK